MRQEPTPRLQSASSRRTTAAGSKDACPSLKSTGDGRNDARAWPQRLVELPASQPDRPDSRRPPRRGATRILCAVEQTARRRRQTASGRHETQLPARRGALVGRAVAPVGRGDSDRRRSQQGQSCLAGRVQRSRQREAPRWQRRRFVRIRAANCPPSHTEPPASPHHSARPVRSTSTSPHRRQRRAEITATEFCGRRS